MYSEDVEITWTYKCTSLTSKDKYEKREREN